MQQKIQEGSKSSDGKEQEHGSSSEGAGCWLGNGREGLVGAVGAVHQDRESSQSHSCLQVRKACLGCGAQTDPGSAETEGKEKRRDSFLMTSLEYQILSSAQPVF